MKNQEIFSILFEKLSEGTISTLILLGLLIWRSPLIMREILTHVRENRRVKAKIQEAQRKADLEIAQKMEKKNISKGKKQ